MIETKLKAKHGAALFAGIILASSLLYASIMLFVSEGGANIYYLIGQLALVGLLFLLFNMKGTKVFMPNSRRPNLLMRVLSVALFAVVAATTARIMSQ